MPRKKEPWDDAVGDAAWAKRIPPAPGHLRIVQAFVNTADLGSERDELASPRALADYLARWKLLPAGTELSDSDLGHTRAVREDLRSLLRSNVGKALDPKVEARLDLAARAPMLRVRFLGGARFEPAGAGLDAVLAGFFQAFGQLLLDQRWPRFKACAGDDCGLCFWDASNNRTRSYCTLRCSNRNKSRTYRRRHSRNR